jgi:hypothetical protein
METLTVTNRDQLAAAIKGASCTTYEEARKNPVQITLADTKTVYTFKDGIHELRANQIVRKLLRTSKRAFAV